MMVTCFAMFNHSISRCNLIPTVTVYAYHAMDDYIFGYETNYIFGCTMSCALWHTNNVHCARGPYHFNVNLDSQ